MKNNPKARTKDLVVRKIGGETLIYDLSNNKAFCLNETSAIVWDICDGKRSIKHISDHIVNKMNSVIDDSLVYLAIDQFSKVGLLENEINSPFRNLSRRKMIRKVGATSLVALPIVVSLTAPSSTTAQSCLPTGDQCPINASCCTPGISCTSFMGGTSCCVPGATNAPGDGICVPSGDAPACNAHGATCCSGMANLDAQLLCNPGEQSCICS